jgi:hypothetical protein
MANNPNHKKNLKKPWQKGESGNVKGRPRKLFSDIAAELKAKGFQEVNAARINEAYQMILGLPLSELKSLMTDADAPVVLKVLIKQLTGSKGFDAIEKILDRAHGKPKQVTSLTAEDDETVSITFVTKKK